jgi:hypothetical protein
MGVTDPPSRCYRRAVLPGVPGSVCVSRPRNLGWVGLSASLWICVRTPCAVGPRGAPAPSPLETCPASPAVSSELPLARPWAQLMVACTLTLLTCFTSLSAYYTSSVVLYLTTPASSTIPLDLLGGILTSGTYDPSLGGGDPVHVPDRPGGEGFHPQEGESPRPRPAMGVE